MARRTVSLIITVHNEERAVGALLDSIRAQTRQPDEIIICDAGSQDRTRDVIAAHQERGLRVRLLVERGANRARGRNLAILQAGGEVIASIDAGCVAEPDWLARLAAPFESREPPDVVSGYYRPEASSLIGWATAGATVPGVGEVDPKTFLPSSRSVAFTREAWERAGGYPEFLDVAEDTAFGRRLRAAGCRFQFAPEAIVRWRMQESVGAVFRQFLRYARSDGEAGHWFPHYTKAFLLLATLAAALAAAYLLPPTAARLAPIWAVVLLGFVYWLRCEVRAKRRGIGAAAALFAGDIAVTADLAHIVGYTIGWLRRRPRAAPAPAGRPLSFAQVTYTYQPITGGADVYVSHLRALIEAGGHRCRVYQRRTKADAKGVRPVPNPWWGLPLEFWTQALALFRLRRELLSHDVVICHYPHYLLALDLMSFFRRRPIRVAVSHGVFWDDAPGALRSAVKASIARLAFRRAHLYIANDTHFLRAMGLPVAPRQRMHSQVAPGVWFIPNGVDTAAFRPAGPQPAPRERKAILVPRNLFRNRGVHLAVEAFADFRKHHPDTGLLIVGSAGQPKYIRSLREDVRRRGLEDSVVFHGHVPHDALPALYARADLTLIPSLCGEGTSLAALESMACGTATICTSVAGLRDLPGPHAPATARGIADALLRVYPNRTGVGEEQRRAVVAHHSIGRWRSAWLEALAGISVPSARRGVTSDDR